MRPLRWGIPLFVLLLIAPLLPGVGNAPQGGRPYAETFVLDAPKCVLPCTPGTWTFGVFASDSVTTLVAEFDLRRAPSELVSLADVRVYALFQGPGMEEDGIHYGFDQPWGGQPSQFWGIFSGFEPGAWTFEIGMLTDVPAASNILSLVDLRFGLTFAYNGYDLPDSYRIFVDDPAGSAQPQTLLENLDLSADKVPCASTSSTTAVNGRIASGAC